MKVHFVREHRNSLPIKKLCSAVGISQSGYYEFLKRVESKRSSQDAKLLPLIQKSFIESRKTYGSRRIADDLNDLGIKCSKNKVLRLMKIKSLKSTHSKKFRVVTTDSKHTMPVAKNVLDRKFNPKQPNQKWAGDITYIQTKEGFVYLSVILDLFSRKVIGFAIDRNMKTQLCSTALNKATVLRKHDLKDNLVHHTDRGSQYASDDYQIQLKGINAICSMSRKGNCWDNSVAESFFKTLKNECVYQTQYENLNQAQEDITDYINNFYNLKRKHSALDYLSPVQYENKYNKNLQLNMAA